MLSVVFLSPFFSYSVCVSSVVDVSSSFFVSFNVTLRIILHWNLLFTSYFLWSKNKWEKSNFFHLWNFNSFSNYQILGEGFIHSFSYLHSKPFIFRVLFFLILKCLWKISWEWCHVSSNFLWHHQHFNISSSMIWKMRVEKWWKWTRDNFNRKKIWKCCCEGNW